jgi:hypothetical protein
MSVTIGVPSKGISPSTVRVIGEALRVPHIDRVLVSINPGIHSEEIPLYIREDSRVTLYFQNSDLGLYGNFRFLLSVCETDKFMWLCTDDSPTLEVQKLADSLDISSSFLAVPSWVWDEYHPDELKFDGSPTLGVYPPSKVVSSKAGRFVYPEPSWIFGLWNTNHLRAIFPKRDFDWLDVHLLQTVMIQGQVISVKTDTVMTIGTWMWANKLPNAISLNGPFSFFAIIYQLKILWKFRRLGLKGILLAASRVETLFVQSRRQRKLRGSSLEK